MPEEELNLIQFTTHQMTEPGAGASQIMWGELFYSCSTRYIDEPPRIPLAPVQPSIAALTQQGSVQLCRPALRQACR